jgi:hypothetical protein
MKPLQLLLVSLTALAGLAGCATTGSAPAIAALPPIAETQEARIADIVARELDRRARYDADSLAGVAPQLHALARALAGPQPVAEQPGSASGHLQAAPEDMVTAPSLWHGIHLASYRSMAHTVAGWAQLQARFPDQLGDREARIETALIPERGEFLRLQAGPYDTLADASAACAAIEQAGEYCMPVAFSGLPLAAAAANAPD